MLTGDGNVREMSFYMRHLDWAKGLEIFETLEFDLFRNVMSCCHFISVNYRSIGKRRVTDWLQGNVLNTQLYQSSLEVKIFNVCNK